MAVLKWVEILHWLLDLLGLLLHFQVDLDILVPILNRVLSRIDAGVLHAEIVGLEADTRWLEHLKPCSNGWVLGQKLLVLKDELVEENRCLLSVFFWEVAAKKLSAHFREDFVSLGHVVYFLVMQA